MAERKPGQDTLWFYMVSLGHPTLDLFLNSSFISYEIPLCQVLTTQVFLSVAQELDSSCLCPIPHPPTPELYLITSALLLNSSFLFWFLCVKFICKFKEEVAWGKESHSVAKMYLKDHFLLKVFLLTYSRVNSSSLISHSTLIINNIPFFLLYMKQCIFTLYL